MSDASRAVYGESDALILHLREVLRGLAKKIGAVPTRLGPDSHDVLCESEYIAPIGATLCDCQHRRELIADALTDRIPAPAPDRALMEALRELFYLCRANYDGTDLRIERRAQPDVDVGALLLKCYRADTRT